LGLFSFGDFMKRTLIASLLAAVALSAMAADTVEGNLVAQQRATGNLQLCTYAVAVKGTHAQVSRLVDSCKATIQVPVTEATEAVKSGR
jgi:hypothetical protein